MLQAISYLIIHMFQTFTIIKKVTVNIMQVAIHFWRGFFFFFNMDHFQSLYLICYNIVCFMFWFFGRQIGMWDLNSLTRD